MRSPARFAIWAVWMDALAAVPTPEATLLAQAFDKEIRHAHEEFLAMVVQFNIGKELLCLRREFERIVARKVDGARLLEDLDGARENLLVCGAGLQDPHQLVAVAAVGEGVDGDQGALALGDV